MLKAHERNERLAHAGEQHGTREGPRHGAGEGEVVIRGGDALDGIVAAAAEERQAVDEDVVSRLEVEGLLYLGVGGGEEVDEGGEEEQGGEGEVCENMSSLILLGMDKICYSYPRVYLPRSFIVRVGLSVSQGVAPGEFTTWVSRYEKKSKLWVQNSVLVLELNMKLHN